MEVTTSLWQRAATELVGTFWLVLGGCGSAVIGAAFPGLGIGHLGVLAAPKATPGPAVASR